MSARRPVVAVVQSLIADDGRTAVLQHALTAVLREIPDDWTVEVWAADSAFARRFLDRYGDPRLGLRPLPALLAHLPASLHIPATGMVAARRLGSVRLLVNLNNTRIPPARDRRDLYYVHHPVEAHGGDRHLAWYSRLVWSMTRLIARHPLAPDARLLTNSAYTRQRIPTHWDVDDDDITVLPPPYTATAAPGNDLTSSSGPPAPYVMTVGAFVPAKRQRDQLRLARSMPDVRFVIAGRSTRRPYAGIVRLEAARLPNVTLAPDLPTPDRDRLLRAATVFLHTRRGEHFGVAIAEAIAAGCIPVVHDSGGAKELVAGFEHLCLYDDLPAARARIREALRLPPEEVARISKALGERLASFDTGSFVDRFGEAVRECLD